MKWPESLEEAFDLSSDEVTEREVQQIRVAFQSRRYKVLDHALDQARKRGVSMADIVRVVLNGAATSKDQPGNDLHRKPGINFEGATLSGGNIRVKVAWLHGYAVVTTHRIREQR